MASWPNPPCGRPKLWAYRQKAPRQAAASVRFSWQLTGTALPFAAQETPSCPLGQNLSVERCFTLTGIALDRLEAALLNPACSHPHVSQEGTLCSSLGLFVLRSSCSPYS